VLRNWRSHFTPEDDEDDKAGFAAEQVEFFKQPSLQEMQRDLAALMRRRVRLFFVYTGQVQHEYNYATQLTDAFPSLRKYELLRLEYMAHADHTFSRAPMRAALIEMLLSWLDSVNKSSSTYASTESSDDELVRDSGFRQMRA
jgi:hypothetical protein